MKMDINEVPNVCSYCRKIMKEDNYPKTLELYRGGMLCLTVDVEKAAKLKLTENVSKSPVYEKFTEHDRAFMNKVARNRVV